MPGFVGIGDGLRTHMLANVAVGFAHFAIGFRLRLADGTGAEIQLPVFVKKTLCQPGRERELAAQMGNQRSSLPPERVPKRRTGGVPRGR